MRTALLLWLFQAPSTLPDLFWIILSSALSLLLGAGVLIYKRDWEILRLRFEAIDDRLKRLERRRGGDQP